MDKIDGAMVTDLENLLSSGISEDAMKSVNKTCEDIVCKIEDDLLYRVKDQLAHHIAGWAADMAQNAVEMMLQGNDDQIRRYLSCEKRGEDGQYIGWTGRSDSQSYGRPREDHEWHQVIHGKLFEQGAVALRKQIVDGHRDLLVNERIIDLEDQVKSLVAQVNRAKAEAERAYERGRAA
ncbi:hypothetical protein AB8A05_03985 [Tardiphaga sp. 538_B7_N1_4]|uniref:hypothetical protein n=1 Tax=Tardiphaga sp. 538_B7_N1_4 TaxID=3240778 RepID=UPI003F27E1AB